MQDAPEAFVLLTLPDTSLTSGGKTENGTLNLACVTLANPEATSNRERDIYLVLRVNIAETPVDPSRIVHRTDTPVFRTYTFSGTQFDPLDIILRVKVPSRGSNPELLDKLDTFDNILEQYVVDFRRPTSAPGPDAVSVSGVPSSFDITRGEKDLRGHIVMINEDTGEVVGEVQDKYKVHEDPSMYEKGRQNDPVIIEIPEQTTRESDANALEAFAHLVPPDQQNWITKSASIVGHAISTTTNLLLTTITSSTDYYVSHSSHSPHHSAPNAAGSGNRTPSANVVSSPPPLPPRPPRVLVFLTSDEARKGFAAVHTISGEAVKISSKTIHAIDGMIRRAMGARPKRNRYFASSSRQGGNISPSPRDPHIGSSLAPPPYQADEKSSTYIAEKSTPPALPPRLSPSPVPPALPHRAGSASTYAPQTGAALPHQPRLTTKERILISADLVLSIIDDSARRILDSGTESVGKVMAHKYGPEAAHASMLLAGTARNVGLVYIDMHGIGRRALLRRAGRTFVKARFSSNKPGPSQMIS